MTALNTTDVITEILLGGLLGILGQGIRMVVGLKKLQSGNATKALNNQPTTPFSTSRLLISLFIGFIAGALCALIKGDPIGSDTKNGYLFAIVAAGYSGADFIEGALIPKK